MKKRVIIGVVAVLIIVVICFMFFKTTAPAFAIDGTYASENGDTATISGNKFSCGEVSGELKAIDRSWDYLGSTRKNAFIIYDLKMDNGETYELTIHCEGQDEDVQTCFLFNDVQYNMAK